MMRLIAAMVAITALFSVSSVSAQRLAGGVRAGLAIADLTGDDAGFTYIDEMGEQRQKEYGSKMGFSAGAFLMVDIFENFAVQPEVLYTMKGGKTEVELGGVTYTITESLNYLEIPVLVKYKIPTPGSLAPNLFFGPALAITLSAEMKIEGDGSEAVDDIKDYCKGTDFGIVLGGGLDFGVGTGKIMVDGRYTLGLTVIDDTEAKADVKNSVFAIMVGYCFQPPL